MKLLEQVGLCPVKITEVQREPVARAAAAGTGAAGPVSSRRGNRVNRKELMHFSLQLSSSLSAGVPLLTSITNFAEQTQNPSFRTVLTQMVLDIQGGASLSSAMARHPRVFPFVYCRTIAAGEQSGTVERMLTDLAEYLEAEMQVISDVRSALLYPAIVVGTLCIAISVLILFVVPRFTEFYSRFGTELPLPTRVLISGTNLLTNHGVLMAIGFAGLVALAMKLVRSPGGRSWIDRALLRVPVLGRLIETALTLRVVQILGLSTQAGLPMLESLDLIASTTSSKKMSGDIRRVASGVRGGATLTESMKAANCFPLPARQMLASGESSGSLERACFAIAKQYQRELHYLTKNLATFIEPLLTLVLAGIVLFVALAVFLPMWNLVKIVQQ